MKKLKLKREWVMVISFIIGVITTILVQNYIEDYKDYLRECDARTGETCNIFGQ